MTILKVTENQGSSLSLEDTFLEKPLGVQAVLGLSLLEVWLYT